MNKLFEISNVSVFNKIYYPQIDIFKDQITFITGESGSGKSTLLKLLNATVTPDEGEIIYNKKNIQQWDTLKLRREVLLAGQETYLFDDSIENNFFTYSNYRGDSQPFPDRIQEYLKICKADFPLDYPCSKLSGGERQRVYLAIFLSFMPKVLLLDEPTSELDENTARNLFENLRELSIQNKMTMIVVSHDLNLRNEFADLIVDLERNEK